MPSSIEIKVTVFFDGEEPWLDLNYLSNAGILRAVFISKPHQVADGDGHHCTGIGAKGSIRYRPKKWSIC